MVFPCNTRLYVGHSVPGKDTPHSFAHVERCVANGMSIHGIAGGTIFPPSTGVWRGATEMSTVAEVLCATQAELESVKELARWLRDVLSQEAVLVVSTPAQAELIGE